MRILAIDIGGTKIAIGLVDNGSLLERVQIATPCVQSAEQFAQVLLEYTKDWMSGVEAIGVSTTGLVSKEGISAINPDTLSFPTPFPLAQALEAATDKPVKMLNDAQAAAWYEFVQLDEPRANMAFITVSTGVGGGIIIDGKLHQGSSGLAGHIGHTSINPNGPICGCGQTGCVEAIASGTAIQKLSSETMIPQLSNIELFEQANINSEAERIINRSAIAIATLCCNLRATLDLDTVVLGGGIGLAKGYLRRVNQAIQSKPRPFRVNVVAAKGDYDACLLGAAHQFEE
ncbi:N-acetylmannosamine kinase [Vibrio maerlii]|uniref:N-acetylmannosamine kinase n=1 Tax=Vibrio maerlii TaxID=2231648 RepID=UPI000E3BC1BA|nr:N-acetylmannosamine kinase [Vibrio maerlii]